jgi:glutathione S-transferase
MTSAAPTIRIYSGPLSMFGAKAEIAAREKCVDFELIMVPFVSAYEPKHREVMRINPKQQVPVLKHGDLEIFDSTQIFEYLEDLRPMPPLWPSEPAARALARLLELKSDEVFFPHIIRLMELRKNPGRRCRDHGARLRGRLLPGDGRYPLGSAVPGRKLLLRRYRFLHGAAVCRADGCAAGCDDASASSMARDHQCAASGAQRGQADGEISLFQQTASSGFPYRFC